MPIRSLVIALAACAPELDEAKTSASETPTTGEVTTTTTTSPTSTPAPLPVCPDADPLPGVDVAVDASCAASGWTVDWTAVQVEWALPIVASLGQPAVGDLDGDGIPEVVLADVDNDLWAFSGDGAGPLWELELPGLYFDPSPSIADLDGDGDLDVVTISFQFEGYSVVGVDGATGLPLWESVLPWGTVPFNAVLASIVTADLEGDGAVEVIVGNVVLAGADGQRLGQGPMGTGSLYCEVGYTLDRSTLPAVADLDLDGQLEVLTGDGAHSADGTLSWSTGPTQGAVAVGNLDDDLQGEQIVSFNPGLCGGSATLRRHEHDGALTWSISLPSVGPASIGDLDGDGRPEVLTQSWDPFSAAQALRAFDADGNERWRWDLPGDLASTQGAVGQSLADFDGDGAYEVVLQVARGVVVLDGAGNPLVELDVGGAPDGAMHPVVADVDADGQLEIVVVERGITPNEPARLVVLGAGDWPAGGTEWRQHAWAAGPLPSWPSHNTFRGADTPAPPRVDAVVEVTSTCDIECDRDRMVVYARVGNVGTAELPAGARLSVWPEGDAIPLDTVAIPVVAAGGVSAELALAFDPADAAGGRVVVGVDSVPAAAFVDCDPASDQVIVDVACQ